MVHDDIQNGWVPVSAEDSTKLQQELSELQAQMMDAWEAYNSLAAQTANVRARLATAVAAEQAELKTLCEASDPAESPFRDQQDTIDRLQYELTKYKVELAFIKGPSYRPED